MTTPEPRRCQALNKRGQPCGVSPMRGRDYCNVHDPESTSAIHFAAGHPGYGGRPRLATKTEIRRQLLSELVAAEWPTITQVFRDGLRAVQTATHQGEVIVSQVPDLGFRRDTAERLIDRVDGRPRTALELSGPDGDPLQVAVLHRVLGAPEAARRASELAELIEADVVEEEAA